MWSSPSPVTPCRRDPRLPGILVKGTEPRDRCQPPVKMASNLVAFTDVETYEETARESIAH